MKVKVTCKNFMWEGVKRVTGDIIDVPELVYNDCVGRLEVVEQPKRRATRKKAEK